MEVMDVDDMGPGRCLASTLPIELLTLVLRNEPKPNRLMELASVCRNWRNTILSEPVLWKHIHVWLASTDRQLSLSLERASGCELSVQIVLQPPMNDPGLLGRLETLLRQHRRIASMLINLHLTYSEDDDDGDITWPAELIEPLGASLDWPKLRRLEIRGTPEPLNVIVLDMVAPTIVELVLYGVEAGDHGWARAGFGPSLRKVELEHCSLGVRFFDALRSCSELRELSLFTESDLTFGPQDLRGAFTLNCLTVLSWYWTDIDLGALLVLLAACPSADHIIIKVDRFISLDASGQHIRGSDFTLPSLREFDLGVDVQHGCGDVMRYLALKKRAPKLHCLTLSGVNLFPAETIGSQLGIIRLDRMRVTASGLRRSLCQCTQLDTLIVQQVVVGPEISDGAETQRLSHLLIASLAGLREEYHFDVIPTTEMPVENQRTLDFFLSVIPTTPFVSITVTDIQVNANELFAIIPASDLEYPQWMKLEEPGDGMGVHINITMQADDRDSPTTRSFCVVSAHESLRMLHTGFQIFSRLALISSQTALLATLFDVLPDELPMLRRLEIIFLHPDEGSKFPALCAAILPRFTSVSCPWLKTIDFHTRTDEEIIVPVTPPVRELFLSRLRSNHEITLEGEDVQLVYLAE